MIVSNNHEERGVYRVFKEMEKGVGQGLVQEYVCVREREREWNKGVGD